MDGPLAQWIRACDSRLRFHKVIRSTRVGVIFIYLKLFSQLLWDENSNKALDFFFISNEQSSLRIACCKSVSYKHT